MSDNQDQFLSDLDLLIKNGQSAEAWDRFKKIKISEIRPNLLKDFSTIARRLQKPLLGLKILRTPIRDHIQQKQKASDEDVIAYCHSLIKLGLFNETKRWLSEISADKYPEVYDLQARAEYGQWNHAAAAPLFKRYLDSIDPDSYLYLVGSLNLSASYLSSGRPASARKWLNQAIEKSVATDKKVILGNCYELMGQVCMDQGKYSESRRYLKRGAKVLGRNMGIWSFYLEKWDFVGQCLKNGYSKELVAEGRRLLKVAKFQGYWEDVREIERHLATIENDEARLLRIYFGTPFASYKRRVIKNYSGKLVIPRELEVTLFGESCSARVFDAHQALKDHPVLEKLFFILTRDFYRPLPVGYVFDSLYSDTWFDPLHSSDRLYDAVKRLRGCLEQEKRGSVHWQSGGIQLIGQRPLKIIVRDQESFADPADRCLKAVRRTFRGSWFTRGQICRELQVSASTALRLIQKGFENYKMEKTGMGRSVRYRFL